MKLRHLVERLDLGVLCGEDKLGNEVSGGYVGDLLSDVMANSSKGNIWITRQSHQNIVAVASLREHAAIILALGKKPDDDTIEKATREGIPVLATDRPGFEIAGQIYALLSNDRSFRAGTES